VTEYEEFVRKLGMIEGSWIDLPIDFSMDRYTERAEKVHYYSFSILTEPMIQEISKYTPILEVGSGTGYWAYEFQKRGLDYIATEPDQDGKNGHSKNKLWTPMESLSAIESIKKYPNRTLLMSWPDYAMEWAYQALLEYTGDILIYEGELDGCTADEQFREELEKNWEEIKYLVGIQWMGIHDALYIYKRKIQKQSYRKIDWEK
jgi:hypothetical protein